MWGESVHFGYSSSPNIDMRVKRECLWTRELGLLEKVKLVEVGEKIMLWHEVSCSHLNCAAAL